MEVRAALPMREAIRAVEEGFISLGAGRAVSPKRLVLQISDFGGSVLCMPAYITDKEALVVKSVSVYPKNQETKGQTLNAIVALLDPRSGNVLAVMEGSSLTAIRTGATAGIATKYMANVGARRVSVFGAGVIGRASAEALKEVLGDPIFVVYDVVGARAERYAKEVSRQLDATVSVASQPRDAVVGADVIITATTSSAPVFDGMHVESGTHINAMGAHTPDSREVDTSTVMRARGRIVVDSREAAMAEAGDLLIPLKSGAIHPMDIFDEIGNMILKDRKARRSPKDVTLFKSVGVAVQDAAAAAAAYRIARAAGIGREIQF
ncbi:MAG: ornithine cyclodeaminase family protein [Candidatus Verstraetearchaeota archaeon]|nr:ornithine cyclodeaminase family protein [Candidatus Verstraetearchaeota archaeon]